MSTSTIAFLVYLLCNVALLWYVLCKERETMGCGPNITVGQTCFDQDNHYVRDSVPQDSDTIPQTLDKLQEAASSYEKVAVWRRSYIIGSMSALIIGLIVSPLVVNSSLPSWSWLFLVPIQLTLCTIQYLSSGFQEFHQHRHVRDNVVALVNKLR
jgi:hypothetical protein